ncbi:hypothetical protein [Glycomyces arizonensis]|uniref:hypothetical protein n=1 Tax=Glycomyces arizonensis TaxID=256035 RepID=UPI001B7F9922|nr:hypothetical protein [Glycomyces arizonensis]
MKRVLWILTFVVGGFFVVRALMEPFMIDFTDPSTYETDWGGPSLIGVLAVHMGPGIVAAVLFIRWLRKTDRRKPTEPTPAE